jgi:hypothetical protein
MMSLLTLVEVPWRVTMLEVNETTNWPRSPRGRDRLRPRAARGGSK